MDQLQNNREHKVYHVGNNTVFAAFWGVVGLLMTTISTALVLNTENESRLIAVDLPVSGAFALIFFGGYHLRRRALVRERRGWIMSAVLHMAVSVVTSVTVVLHKTTLEGVVAQMLVAVGMFALGEVVKPVVDFGIVQGFLRMPLQTSLVCIWKDQDPRVGASHVAIAAIILVVGTFWQVYFAIGEDWPNAAPEANNNNNRGQLPLRDLGISHSSRRLSHSPRRLPPPLNQINAQVVYASPRLSQSSRLSHSPRLSSARPSPRALNNQENIEQENIDRETWRND